MGYGGGGGGGDVIGMFVTMGWDADGGAAELLIDVQRHHRMNFPNCVFLLFSSSI